MKKEDSQFDKYQLKRWKDSSAESKLDWLAVALEFARAEKKITKYVKD